MPCIKCIISGRVQGVFFRASTREQALSLGLNGLAQNLPDGRVAVTACGSQDALDAMQDWLWQGPPQAAVSDVRCEACPEPPGLAGFATG